MMELIAKDWIKDLFEKTKSSSLNGRKEFYSFGSSVNLIDEDSLSKD